jgi:alkaline phosphatase D
MKRREFLGAAALGAGWFVVSACASPVRLGVAPSIQRPSGFAFPQGVASADPTPSSVVLWTRVMAQDEAPAPIPVRAQLSLEPSFEEVVVDEALEAGAQSDHTLRVVVQDLSPNTFYYYRFLVGDGGSRTGRTRTAPASDSPREVRFAFVSCQNYEQGLFTGYRRMLSEDVAAPESEQLDVVLHLGDFIYETIGMSPLGGDGRPLVDGAGKPRHIEAFPSGGGGEWLGMPYAASLEDYRHLYKTYLSDPDIQAARARWPFVCTWDDHEFSNDGWQSRSTYRVPDEPAQRRKLAANQAWFEFVPAHLSGTTGVYSVLQRAHDFRPTSVKDAAFVGTDAAGLDREANNRAAIASLSIYRSLRFGKHAEIILTDTRSYRSDHPVPDEVALAQFGSRKMLPLQVVNACDAGRSYKEGRAPKTLHGPKGEFANPRRSTPVGTMLGTTQKRWFKQTLLDSSATWKLWANSVPLLPIRLDMQHLDSENQELVLSPDTWDGYSRERGELMRFVAKRDIRNFVSFTGDNHMHFAGQLMRDFDAARLQPVGAEFAVAGISSASMFELLPLIAGPRFEALVRYDSRPFGGNESAVELLNMTLLDGTQAARVTAETGDSEAGAELSNPEHARHLRYMDTNGYGYGLARVAEAGMDVRYVSIAPPHRDSKRQGAPLLRRVRFYVPATKAGGTPRLDGPSFDEGTPPFPF